MIGFALLCCCEHHDEWRARQAVKALASAPELQVPHYMQRVISFGRLALVDIEQVIQGAEPAGRLRLLEALRKIGDPEAIPLARIIARWDANPLVKKEAKITLQALLEQGPVQD